MKNAALVALTALALSSAAYAEPSAELSHAAALCRQHVRLRMATQPVQPGGSMFLPGWEHCEKINAEYNKQADQAGEAARDAANAADIAATKAIADKLKK